MCTSAKDRFAHIQKLALALLVAKLLTSATIRLMICCFHAHVTCLHVTTRILSNLEDLYDKANGIHKDANKHGPCQNARLGLSLRTDTPQTLDT